MDWQSRQTMGHKTDSPVTSPYGEGHLLEMLEKMDHRMILPEIHPGWHTVLHGDESKTKPKDAGVHYISVPGECLQNFEKICIDVDVYASGAGFLVEFLRKCPKDAIAIRKEYIPATGIHTGRVNADAVQWPVSWNVAGKDLAKQKEKEKKDE